MTLSQHTKGPLSSREKFTEGLTISCNEMCSVVDAETRIIALCESKEDADLFAAAPDLLEALKLAARYLSHPDVLAVTKNMALSGEGLNERINASIAKAEGK